MRDEQGRAAPVPADPPRTAILFTSFLRLGATAFGGPAMVVHIGQLAFRRKWLSQDEFSEGVALCQSIPGATAMQTAAYVGLRTGGMRGAAAAYAGFGLPAVSLMIAASAAYSQVAHLAPAETAFRGLRAMIVALTANAAVAFARAHVRSVADVLVALICAVALFAGATPVAVIGAAIALELTVRRGVLRGSTAAPARPWPLGTARVALGLLGAASVLVVLLLAVAPRLGALAAICMKVDALAFGGGFASVPLMFREMVSARSWLDARTFLDGIALGQVTPGPIVVTATFVGYQLAGIAGALVATASIFFPSFVMVIAAAPRFGALRGRRWFEPALHGAMLSFIGFIGLLASVTVQFATNVTWSMGTAAIAVVAFVALWFRVDVLWVVLASSAAALIL